MSGEFELGWIEERVHSSQFCYAHVCNKLFSFIDSLIMTVLEFDMGNLVVWKEFKGYGDFLQKLVAKSW